MRRIFLVLVLLFMVSVVYAEISVFDDPVIFEEGDLVREGDFNRDGNTDHWLYSLRDGTVQKVVRDLDFDGNIDAVQWTFLRNKQVGQFEKILIDSPVDGVVDVIQYYDMNNKIIRTENNPTL